MLARWEKVAAAGQPLALYNEMTELALVIIGDVLFGVDLWTDAAEMAKSAQSALAVLKKRVAALAPLPLWVPTSDNRRFNRAMRLLNDRISEIVERKRTTAADDGAKLPRDVDVGSRHRDRRGHDRQAAA